MTMIIIIIMSVTDVVHKNMLSTLSKVHYCYVLHLVPCTHFLGSFWISAVQLPKRTYLEIKMYKKSSKYCRAAVYHPH